LLSHDESMALAGTSKRRLTMALITKKSDSRATVQEVADKLSDLEDPRKSIWRNLLFPAFSVFFFISFGLLVNPIVDLVILIGVLLLHELGHFAAMTIFGYRDVRLFFIPLFGGAVFGKAANVSTTKKSIVYLAGPVPGILLGFVVGLIGALFNSSVLVQAGSILIIINGFNLLPVIPLDGGRLLNDVVFSRNRYAETVFNGLAGGALVVGAFFLRDIFLAIMGFFVLISIRYSSGIRKIAEELKQEQNFSPHFSLLEAPPIVIRKVIRSVLHEFPQLYKPKALANLTSTLWNQLMATPPKALPTVAILSSYILAWVIPLAFLLVP